MTLYIYYYYKSIFIPQDTGQIVSELLKLQLVLEWQSLCKGDFWNFITNKLNSKWFFRRAAMLIFCIRLNWNPAINKFKSSYIVFLSSTKIIPYLLEEASLISSMPFQFQFWMAAMLFLCKYFLKCWLFLSFARS